MRLSTIRTLVAGLAATIVLTATVTWVAPMFLGHPVDGIAGTARILGMGTSFGPLVHFLFGIVVLPLVFTRILARVLPGPFPFRGLQWGLLLWLLAELVVMPAAGAGRFHAAAGGAPAALWSLVAHLLYGLVLGVFLKPRARARDLVEMRESMGSVAWKDL